MGAIGLLFRSDWFQAVDGNPECSVFRNDDCARLSLGGFLGMFPWVIWYLCLDCGRLYVVIFGCLCPGYGRGSLFWADAPFLFLGEVMSLFRLLYWHLFLVLFLIVGALPFLEINSYLSKKKKKKRPVEYLRFEPQ